jgi:hypothetical protein
MSNYKTMKFSPIALVGILAFLPPFAFSQSQQKESANVWAQAEAKIEAHLKAIDPKMRSVEVKSERLKKYLPQFRIFVRFDRDRVERSGLVLANQDAEVTDLGDESWHGDAGTQYLRVPRLTEFVRDRKIQVKTQEDAIEFTKFFEGLQGAPNYVASLRVNTKNLAAFDKRILEMEHPSKDWKYTSVKRGGGWKVMVQYVGDPSVSIMTPPTYEVDVDEQDNFRDLRRYDSLNR